ncbi:MAG: nitroreductase/quinone reductase family protein [Anaerolineales bacterium]
MALKRWLYRDNRPHALAKALNAGWELVHSSGIFPAWVTLEVVGRRSGKPIRFPLAMATLHGQRYLVSMLGKDANWVRNLQAAGGRAILRHGKVENVLLEEVALSQRPEILRAYLQVAPGARPHIPVDKDAPLAEFEAIAAQFPVFHVVDAPGATKPV